MRILAITSILLLFKSAFAIGVGNSYVDQVGDIFKEDCSIISDQAIREGIIELSNVYESIAVTKDPNCSPQAVAPDLNNLMRGPVCDYLGSQRSRYDFCKPRPTDADTEIPMDLNPYVEDIPWAKTIGALVSYSEIMIRNKCFEKVIGDGQNFGAVISNMLGIVQNVSMATAPIEPTMASIAIGSRLGMILFSAIGALIDATEERNRSVNPLLFSTKMCGLRKYLLNRQRAKCLSGCLESLKEADEKIECSLCNLRPTKNAFDQLTNIYGQYTNLLNKISSFELSSSDQLITPEQQNTLEALVSTINSDRNLMAEKLGYQSTSDFTDKYFDVTNQNDPRFAWLDYEKPPTTVSKQKDEINLIMGIPGLILKNHLCDDPQRQLLEDQYFRQYLKFNEKELDPLCEKMELYYQCSRNGGWKDPRQTECRQERTRLDNPSYSPMNFIKHSKVKDFMNALQIQKLTQEIKSNNSSCFTIEHCQANKYNCMATLNTFDGVSSCGALANLSADSRQLKFLNKIKEKDYVAFHRLYLQQRIHKITENSDYQNFLNLDFAQKELQTLISTISSQRDYEICMFERHEHEREKFCLEEYETMKRIAMQTIGDCLFTDPEEGYEGANYDISDLSWKEFFKSNNSDGNLESTVNKVLMAQQDPWEEYKLDQTSDPKESEELQKTALNLCKTLYCPLKKLEEDKTPFNLFNIFTWFGLDNPPLIRHSDYIRHRILAECPRLYQQTYPSDSNGSNENYDQLISCTELECSSIINNVTSSFSNTYHTNLDLQLCLESPR